MARTRNGRLVGARSKRTTTARRRTLKVVIHGKKMAHYHLPRRPLFPLSQRQAMTHKYVEYTDLDPAAGTVAVHRYRVNSLYDPDYTGVGSQPMYRDQMAELYNNYVVDGSRIKVTLLPVTSLGENVDLRDIPVLAVTKDDDTTTPTTMQAIMEQGTVNQRYRVVKSDATPTIVSLSWSLKKSSAVSDIMNPDWIAATGGNPNSGPHYRVVYGNLAGTNVSACRVLIELSYHAVWFNPIESNRS